MSFRLYDHRRKQWVKDGFYVNSFGDVCFPKKMVFGNGKMSLASETRYTLHQSVGAYDVNGIMIFEGDICRNCKDHDIVGVVSYYPEQAAYLLFEAKYDAKYKMNAFMIDNNSRSEMEVIGNVIDNQDLVMESFEKNSDIKPESDAEKEEVNE